MAHSSVAAKLKEWLDAEGGVRDWDISRDAPYFGFPIPDAPGKFFYVWLDAPIGYLASFKKYCASEQGREERADAGIVRSLHAARTIPSFDRSAEMHHFLGKDIVNFHGLFWPAMLEGAQLRTPTELHVNGYLTVNGEKMSKSRGTFIQARTYLDAGLNPEYLRYYFATMLGAAPTDIDLDLKAFEERVNSHLVGKFVNIASRCGGIRCTSIFDGRLAARSAAFTQTGKTDIYRHMLQTLRRCCEACTATAILRQCMRNSCSAADYVNDYIAEQAALGAGERSEAQREGVASSSARSRINAFRLLTHLSATRSSRQPRARRRISLAIEIEALRSTREHSAVGNMQSRSL